MNLKLSAHLILLQLMLPQIQGKFKANPPAQRGLIQTSASRPKQIGVSFPIKGKNGVSFLWVQGSQSTLHNTMCTIQWKTAPPVCLKDRADLYCLLKVSPGYTKPNPTKARGSQAENQNTASTWTCEVLGVGRGLRFSKPESSV